MKKRIISCVLVFVILFCISGFNYTFALSAESKPHFYDVTLDKEGEILGDGDTITITCKFSDSQLNFDRCYALICAYSTNIRIELLYDNSKSIFSGTYVLGDTYDNSNGPCHIMLIDSPYEFGITTYFNESTHPFGEKSFIFNNKCKQNIHYPITTISKVDAICDKDGHSEEIKCSLCKTLIKKSENIPALNHKYVNSCDTSCNVCGATRKITHTFGEYVYNNDATVEKDGTKTRTCSVCGQKETVTAIGTKWKSSFTDIKTKDFYYKPTLWAVANGITSGTSKTTFSPEEPCTRGQVVTFLWRAAGCPEPTSTTMPFTDVGSKAFYRKAVLWAVEQGITSGTSATTFGPNETCTRGQIATFLWRAKGKPTPKSSNMPFVDVSAKNFAYKAVLWAVENKITSGTSKTTFAPSDPCTRGQIVTFLYRAYK